MPSAITGTWVLEKLKLAVERGYWVLMIHVFYEYQVTQ
jgi:hypothetical protein